MAKWMTITKIIATLVAAFNLNDLQEKELENYAKRCQSAWVEKRDEEVETILRDQARIISK